VKRISTPSTPSWTELYNHLILYKNDLNMAFLIMKKTINGFVICWKERKHTLQDCF